MQTTKYGNMVDIEALLDILAHGLRELARIWREIYFDFFNILRCVEGEETPQTRTLKGFKHSSNGPVDRFSLLGNYRCTVHSVVKATQVIIIGGCSQPDSPGR